MEQKRKSIIFLIVAGCGLILLGLLINAFSSDWPELLRSYLWLRWPILGLIAGLLVWRRFRKGRVAAMSTREINREVTSTTAPRHRHQSYGQDGEGWVQPGTSSTDAVVFVHGFSGHSNKTWTWRPPWYKRLWGKRAVNLPGDLLTSEPNLSCDYYSFGHSARSFDIAATQDLANALRTFLDNTVAEGRAFRRVILVSHSLGGVICRQMILDQFDASVALRFEIIGLLMMGTPNLGTDIARLAPSRSARDIEPWEKYLEVLNRNWLRRIVNGGDPDLEPTGRARLKCGVLYGLRDRVVPIASATAGVYLGELHAVNKGHIALPKCASKEDLTYQALKRFISDSQIEAGRGPVRLAADILSYHARSRILEPGLEWTREENEIIELSSHEKFGPDVLKCEITSTRIGGELRGEVVICLSIEGNAPKNIPIDYNYLFGKGMLTDADYTSMGDSLRAASLKKEDFEKLLSVMIRVIWTDAGEERESLLTNADLQNGPGYALLRYPMALDASKTGRNNRVVLSLSSTVRRRQGWYGFRSTRTVIQQMELQVIAPFRVHLISNLWWCAAREREDRLGNQRYSSKIAIPGPIPAGMNVIWLFDPETAKTTEVSGARDDNEKEGKEAPKEKSQEGKVGEEEVG